MRRDNLLVSISARAYHEYAVLGTCEWTRLLVERIEAERPLMRSEPTLLDVGMGTGHLLLELANRPSLTDVSLVGIDLDSAMVDFARAAIAAAGLSKRIGVSVADVHCLPFADHSVDLVVGRSVIHHWAEPTIAFREISRVLRPEGLAIIHEPLRDPDAAALAAFNAERRRLGIVEMTLDEKYTLAEIDDMLDRAGLAGASHTELGTGIAALGCEVQIGNARSA